MVGDVTQRLDKVREGAELRMNKIEADVAEVQASQTLMHAQLNKNSAQLSIIDQRTEPLAEMADGVKGLRILGKLAMWVGGIAGGMAIFKTFLTGE